MQDPTQLYASIQTLVQNDARNTAMDVYNTLGTKYSVAQVPTHLHNGTDSVQISQDDILFGTKYTTSIIENASETTTFKIFKYPSRISLMGFAANNADASPATKRAILNGEAQFGRCFQFSTSTSTNPSGSTLEIGVPIVQISNAMYMDSTDLTKTRVSQANGAIAYCVDDLGATVAQLIINSITNNVVSITSVVGTNWEITASLIFS